MGTAPTIVFDFINKSVVTTGVSADADRRVQDFLTQQQAQSPAPAAAAASRNAE